MPPHAARPVQVFTRVASRVLTVSDPWHRSSRAEGLRRLAGRVAWEGVLRRSAPGTVIRQRLISGAQLDLEVHDRLQGETALLRSYEPALVRALLELTPPGGVVFDVGANVGLVSAELLALTEHRGVQVHAFEPHPENVTALRRNLAPYPAERAHVVPVAVGAGSGTIEMLVSHDSHETGGHRVGSTLSSEHPPEALIEVQMTSLDAYAESAGIERVDVVKIDVEGFELPVLRGAERLLAAGAIGAIIAEEGPERERESRMITELLTEHGFDSRLLPSTSPAHLLRRTQHLAPRDVAYERR